MNYKVYGPFCSKHCSGCYGAELKNGTCKRLTRTKIGVKYYRKRDENNARVVQR